MPGLRPPATSECKLPQKLVDAIIDQLYYDKASLRQCSLVCRSWVPRTSEHLFSCFSWPRCTRTDRECAKREYGGKHCFDKCLRILKNSPRICGIISDLCLQHHGCKRFHDDYARHGNAIPLGVLHEMLSLLPSLRQLTLSYCFPSLPWWREIRWWREIPRQPRFILDGVRILHSNPRLQATADLLTMFETATYLRLSWPAIGHCGSPPKAAVARSGATTAIHALDLPFVSSEESRVQIFRTLLGVIDPKSLRGIATRSTLTPAVIAILEPYAASLRILSYTAHREHPAAALPRFPRLVSLSLLSHDSILEPQMLSESWSLALRDLEHFVHTDIKEIRIELSISAKDIPDDRSPHAMHDDLRRSFSGLGWEDLGKTLSKYTSLTRLVFGLWASLCDDRRDAVIEQAMAIVQELARKNLPLEMSEKLVIRRGLPCALFAS